MEDKIYKAKLSLQELMTYLEDDEDKHVQKVLKECRTLIEDIRPNHKLDKNNNWYKE